MNFFEYYFTVIYRNIPVSYGTITITSNPTFISPVTCGFLKPDVLHVVGIRLKLGSSANPYIVKLDCSVEGFNTFGVLIIENNRKYSRFYWFKKKYAFVCAAGLHLCVQ